MCAVYMHYAKVNAWTRCTLQLMLDELHAKYMHYHAHANNII